ncbi:MAG: hypothetical protein LBP42_07880 [Treponema sp.]|nr:hypothetical protein [Treponema sp.]
MEPKKHALIVTDGAESTGKIAQHIAGALKEVHAVVLTAAAFSGADILPADVYFFGCEEPHPASFSYLEALLNHINLVGRPCGLFSPKSEKAVQYLADMVHDSELALKALPFVAGEPGQIQRWAAELTGEGYNNHKDG